jgi:hypothetical protein
VLGRFNLAARHPHLQFLVVSSMRVLPEFASTRMTVFYFTAVYIVANGPVNNLTRASTGIGTGQSPAYFICH